MRIIDGPVIKRGHFLVVFTSKHLQFEWRTTARIFALYIIHYMEKPFKLRRYNVMVKINAFFMRLTYENG